MSMPISRSFQKPFQIAPLFISLSLFSGVALSGESIEFPEEELARETVLPQFDSTTSVKNRNITVKGRLELGVGAGTNLTEALYNNQNFYGNLHYNFSETHAIGFTGIFISKGLSRMGKSLRAGEGLGGDTFDPSLAPYPESILLAEYQLTAYYGKISITKLSVMNLSLYGLLGGGVVSFGDSKSPAFNIGLGQKFYFNKYFSFRYDLRFIFYQGPNPVQDDPDLRVGDSPVSSNDLDKTEYFPVFLNFGLEFII